MTTTYRYEERTPAGTWVVMATGLNDEQANEIRAALNHAAQSPVEGEDYRFVVE